MEKVDEAGQELSFGEKVTDTIQSPGKAHSFSENTGSVTDGAVALAPSSLFSRGLEDAV